MTLVKLTGLAALVYFIALASAAQADPDWVLLGERSVDQRMDHDEIVVKEGDFHRIALRVQGAAVEFHKVEVHFANGKVQEVELRDEIQAGGESRPIDLEGEDRLIKRVVFDYQTGALGGPRAVVQVWGLS